MPVAGSFIGGGWSGNSGGGTIYKAASGGAPGGAPTYTVPTPPPHTSSTLGPVGASARDRYPILYSSPQRSLQQQYPQLYEAYQTERAATAMKGRVDAFYEPQNTQLALLLKNQKTGYIQNDIDTETQRGFAQSDAALSRRKLELERGLANGQLGNIEKLRALAVEQKANQIAGIANKENETRDMAGRQKWDLRSALTARGATSTIANERGTGRIDRDLYYNMGALGLARDQADISYRQGEVGYDNQALGLQNRLAGIGIDSEAIANNLASGLYRLGMDSKSTLDQIADAINGTDTQKAAVAQQQMDMLSQLTGIPIGTLLQLFPPSKG